MSCRVVIAVAYEKVGKYRILVKVIDIFGNDTSQAFDVVPFRYYYCQREAIETLVWLIEIARQVCWSEASGSVRSLRVR
jgi:hypothetical protein